MLGAWLKSKLRLRPYIRVKPSGLRGSEKNNGLTNERIRKKLIEIHAGKARIPSQPSSLGKEFSFDVLKEYELDSFRKVTLGYHGQEPVYIVEEPQLDVVEAATYAAVLDELYYSFSLEEVPSDENMRLQLLREQVENTAQRLGQELDSRSAGKVIYYLKRDIFGYSIIDALLNDPLVEDVKVTSQNEPVFVKHKDFGQHWMASNIFFKSEDELADFIRRQAHRSGRGISVARPLADFRLQEGYRMSAALGREVSMHGSNFTIRKFPHEPITLIQLVSDKMLTALEAAYLWFVMEKKRLFIIAGPTGSGKTTLLNSLLTMLPRTRSYITIEDPPEISLHSPRWQAFFPRTSGIGGGREVTVEDLMAHSVRNRPEVMVLGEARTTEQLMSWIQAGTAGHTGVCTFHAADPEHEVVRLKSMNIVASALDILWGSAICNYTEKGIGIRRRVTSIVEFVPVERDVKVCGVFEWNAVLDTVSPGGVKELGERSVRLSMLAESSKTSLEQVLEDIHGRSLFIDELLLQEAIRLRDICDEVEKFYARRVSGRVLV